MNPSPVAGMACISTWVPSGSAALQSVGQTLNCSSSDGTKARQRTVPSPITVIEMVLSAAAEETRYSQQLPTMARNRIIHVHPTRTSVELQSDGVGFGSAFDAGGGTRTPDTRIMIPLL